MKKDSTNENGFTSCQRGHQIDALVEKLPCAVMTRFSGFAAHSEHDARKNHAQSLPFRRISA
jgi:hypothetical protein